MKNEKGTNQEGRDEKGRFLNGANPGPGRPRGARSRLGEAFLGDLADAWADHGVEAIERVAKSDPSTFIKVVANVLPKEIVQMAFSLTAATNLQEIERVSGIMAAYRYARDAIGAVPLDKAGPLGVFRPDGTDNPATIEAEAEGVLFTDAWAHGND